MKRWLALAVCLAFNFNAAAINMEQKTIPNGSSRIIFDGALGPEQIAITFGGPIVPAVTLELLAILKEQNLRAHFFVSGLSAMKHPKVVEQILKDGHVLGSGGYGKSLSTAEDKTFEQMSLVIESEITMGHEMVYSTGGIIFPFVRFPAGRDTLQARKFIRGSLVYLFYWNIDYEIEKPAESIKAALEREGNRGIVSLSMAKTESILALKALLEEAEGKGLTVITLMPPESTDWRKNPPLIRNQILDVIEKKGSLLKQSNTGIDI